MFTIRNISEALEGISKILNRGAGAGLGEYQEFAKILKDKTATEQQSLLTAEIERQRKVLEGLAEKRREQIRLTESERRVVRKFAETEIEKLDEIQTPLIEILRFFEGQLDALGKINKELDDEAMTQKEIFDTWVKENDARRDAINLQKELTAAILESKQAAIEGILEADKERKRVAKENELTPGDLWGNFGDDEVWEGGREPWEELADRMNNAKAAAKEFGRLMSQMLVSQFDKLGEAIGRFVSGAEGAFKSLGDAILQNLGNILIMLGAQTGNIPLVLAGAGIQLGGGILRGLGRDAGQARGRFNQNGGQHTFRVEGKDLVTVLGRQGYSNNLNT